MQNVVFIPVCFAKLKHTISAVAVAKQNGDVDLYFFDSLQKADFDKSVIFKKAGAALANLFHVSYQLYAKERSNNECHITVIEVDPEMNGQQVIGGNSCGAHVAFRAICLLDSPSLFKRVLSVGEVETWQEKDVRFYVVIIHVLYL